MDSKDPWDTLARKIQIDVSKAIKRHISSLRESNEVNYLVNKQIFNSPISSMATLPDVIRFYGSRV